MTNYSKEVNELWEWACVVLPVFGDELRKTWSHTPFVFTKHGDVMSNKEAAKHLVEILSDPHHEDRLTLAMDAYFYGNSAPIRFKNSPDIERSFKEYIQEQWNALNKGE